MLSKIELSGFEEFLSHVELLSNTEIYKTMDTVKERLKFLLSDEYIKNKILWILPKIIDVSDKLGLSSKEGKVYALSFPEIDSSIHLKTPIFAGLFLLQVINGKISNKTKTITEAGGINTGYGLKKIIDIFNLKGKFYTSRYLPEELFCDISSENMEIIKSKENNALGIEEEFYMEFVQSFKKLRLNGDIAPLWHVKNSFIIAEILAEDILENNPHMLDNIDSYVSGVGSGASLSILSKLKEHTNKNIEIIIAEHEKTPIFWNTSTRNELDELETNTSHEILKTHFIDVKNKRIPHIVYGPHYEKINNKIPSKYLEKISGVSLYSDNEWKDISITLEKEGMLIGNSSAANLAIAKKIALTGKNSLTFIYETKRDYIRKQK
ncbi:MAG TPA: hypothetical protein EYG89_03265 [Bacteroidia bacterium]|nr:hypothetical protein [Bacteroidia bacterium]